MTPKARLRNRFERWVSVLAANAPGSRPAVAAVAEMFATFRRDGASPEQAARLLAIVAGAARDIRDATQRHLATGTVQ